MSRKSEVRVSEGETHATIQVFTPSGWMWVASWANPAPTPDEALQAWRDDTNSGRREHKSWVRR